MTSAAADHAELRFYGTRTLQRTPPNAINYYTDATCSENRLRRATTSLLFAFNWCLYRSDERASCAAGTWGLMKTGPDDVTRDVGKSVAVWCYHVRSTAVGGPFPSYQHYIDLYYVDTISFRCHDPVEFGAQSKNHISGSRQKLRMHW